MSEKRRKISFSETPRVRSYSNCDPIYMKAIQQLRVSESNPARRRFSEVSRPDATNLHIPGTRNGEALPSPRHQGDSGSRKGGMSPATSQGKLVDKSAAVVTVDRYITSIVQLCSNEALASPLDPPPKGSDEYEQVLEELKDK